MEDWWREEGAMGSSELGGLQNSKSKLMWDGRRKAKGYSQEKKKNDIVTDRGLKFEVPAQPEEGPLSPVAVVLPLVHVPV
jgi:hypothetical protein